MDDEQHTILGNNRIEDVRWLCSLTDSELDVLIGLKSMILRRAKRIGHVGLAKEFDLKMLRGLSFTLMENLKGQLKQLATAPSLTESSTFLDECNLLKCDPDESFASLGVEELRTYVCSDQKKRIADMFNQDMIPTKKQKTDAGGPDQT